MRRREGVPLFANRLKALRRQNGLSQTDIAEIVSETYQAVGKWEQGIVEPGFATLIKLSLLFDVTTDYLLGLTDER